MLKTVEINSISDLIEHVGRLQDHYHQSILWFRGQRCAQWSLLPAVFRDGHETEERNYVHRFRARAGTRYPNAPAYGEFALWLSLMQHYKLPTRLLDWTRSPLIAAYFALEEMIYSKRGSDDEPPNDDAVIRVLEPFTLNRVVCGKKVTPAIYLTRARICGENNKIVTCVRIRHYNGKCSRSEKFRRWPLWQL